MKATLILAVQFLLCSVAVAQVQERAGAACDVNAFAWDDCVIDVEETIMLEHTVAMENVHIICHTTTTCIVGKANLFMSKVKVSTTKAQGTFLYLHGTADLVAEQVTVTGFNAPGGKIEDGGAIFADPGSDIVLNRCTFTDNTAVKYGGALSLKGVTLVMTGCTFIRNHAPLGGGALTLIESAATISKTTFQGNSARSVGDPVSHAHAGGALYMKASDLTMARCNFVHNFASWKGGAIDMYTSDVTIWQTTFMGNEAESIGALEANDCKMTMTDSTFSKNIAAEYGGAIGIRSADSAVTMRGNSFTGNKAPTGKGADYYCEANGRYKVFVTITPAIPDEFTYDQRGLCDTIQYQAISHKYPGGIRYF